MRIRKNTRDEPSFSRRPHPSVRYHRPLIVLALGVIVSVLLFFRVQESERLQLKAEFDKRAQHLMVTLSNSLQNNLDALHAIHSFYLSSQEVNRGEFQKFVTYLLLRHPNIFALEWVPRVSRHKRAEFENQKRSEGHPDFQIIEYEAKKRIATRAGQRREYFPVDYVEPFEENQWLFGLDYGAHSEERMAMEKARDSGRFVATRVSKLLRFQHEPFLAPHGFQVFAPIYQKDTTLSIEDRRRRLLGFAVAVFHVGELVELSLYGNDFAAGVEIRIYARTTESDNDLIYTFRPRGAEPSPPNALTLRRNFNVAGQAWIVGGRSTPEFFEMNRRWESKAALSIGILLTLVLSIYFYYLEKEKIREFTYVLSITDELTGLYNRRGFLTLAEQQFKSASKRHKRFALIAADLDHLKQINDSFGHAEGDRALIQVSEVLRSNFREQDVIARMGGDEFAAMVPGASHENLSLLLNHVKKVLQDRPREEGLPYPLSLSLGVAHFDPTKPCSFNELMERADQHLYEQKKLKTVAS